MTKLGLLADRLVEAGWLVLVAVTPLYFGVFSNRVFEPDKLIAMRCLALVMGAAFIIGWLERWRYDAPAVAGGWARLPGSLLRSLRSDPILAATVALVAVSALATITSIVPRTSLWGSYVRLQGLYTLLSFVAVFLMMRQRLRSQAQVDRLVTVIIITALPVAIYGILQHFGIDLLPWSGDTTFRVTSTMGNAIFLAAYLGMVVPLAAAKLVGSLRQLATAPDDAEGEGSIMGIARYGGVVVIQVAFMALYILSAGINPGLWWGMLPAIVIFVSLTSILPSHRATRRWLRAEALGLGLTLLIVLGAVFFTQSRGPWIGLGAGLAVLAVLASVVNGSRRWALGAAVASLSLAALLLVFNLPNSPLSPWRELPYIGRLGTLMEASTGTGKVRVLIWQGVGELMTTLPGVGLGDDNLRALRPLLGYGPESMYVAYNKVYQPELAHYEARTASPDRSHNDLMDYLVTTGVLGLVSYLALLASIMAIAWQSLRRALDPNVKMVLVGLVAALVSHFVESQFGIVVASTRTLFWVYAGIVAATALMVRAASEGGGEERGLGEGDSLGNQRRGVAYAASPARVSNDEARGDRGRKPKEDNRVGQQRSRMAEAAAARDRGAVDAADTSTVLGLWGIAGYLMVTMLALALLARSSSIEDPRLGVGLGVLWMVVGLAAIATHLSSLGLALDSTPELVWDRGRGWWQARSICVTRWLPVYLALVLATAFVCLMNVDAVAADIHYKRGLNEDVRADAATRAGQQPEAIRQRLAGIDEYRQALSLVPEEDYYYLFLGRSYIELARLTQNNSVGGQVDASLRTALELPLADVAKLSRDELMQLSRAVLEEAYRLSPLNTDHSANLARMYRSWGEISGDADKLAAATDYYRRATKLSPRSAHLLCEWAQVELMRGNLQNALQTLEAAEALDPLFPPVFILRGDAYLANGDWDEALRAHSRALQLDGVALSDQRLDWRTQLYFDSGKADGLADAYRQAVATQPDRGPVHGAYGFILFRQGKLTEAAEEFEVYAKLSPGDWFAYRNLALTYQELGRRSEALAAAERALKLAPTSQTPMLHDLVESLRKGDSN